MTCPFERLLQSLPISIRHLILRPQVVVHHPIHEIGPDRAYDNHGHDDYHDQPLELQQIVRVSFLILGARSRRPLDRITNLLYAIFGCLYHDEPLENQEERLEQLKDIVEHLLAGGEVRGLEVALAILDHLVVHGQKCGLVSLV